ncbi:MAG: hypothetical protein KDD35_08700 [Bdellovibrionales bacterium]|nr:hypothetical protein [Bdellovibrionales bacterium]
MSLKGCSLGLVLSLLLVGLLSCQTPQPTEIRETRIQDLKDLSQRMNAPVELNENLIVIDTRSRFDYVMAHIPGSIHLTWEELAQVRSSTPGKIQKEHGRLVRRLALLGLEPLSSVLILGKGLRGRGEEGRLAWTLYYLGLNKIQIGNIELFARLMTNVESAPKKNAENWEPNIRYSIDASKDEVIAAARSGDSTVHLIDVRSSKEYFHKAGDGLNYSLPDLRAVNIEWREFFQSDGRPQFQMRDKLRAINIQLNDRIIVLSQKGVRSAAVTMALLSMGFKHAANYSGGYVELVGSY